MKIIKTVKELRSELSNHRGERIGFVPTMGFLHAGHLSLVRACRSKADLTVVSVFVNPTQFGPNEDYDRYPRDEERDANMLASEGVDIMFVPQPSEIYPEGNATDITVNADMTKKLCAKTRPTHFDGVTNVVARLFCLIKPDMAFFGRKDAQQLAIIQRMAKDLLIGTEVIGCPIVREADGLALSSRNTYLTPKERVDALSISKSLLQAEKDVDSGMHAEQVRERIIQTIEQADGRVDYVEIVDPNTLEEIELLDGDYLIAVAAYFGKTRLIDNIARMNGECI